MPKNDFQHDRGPRYPAYALWTRQTYRPTDRLIYISREISVKHPSVGLVSLAQLSPYL